MRSRKRETDEQKIRQRRSTQTCDSPTGLATHPSLAPVLVRRLPVHGGNRRLCNVGRPFVAATDAPVLGDALTSPTSVSQFRSEFDAFLYAPVEEHTDGPLLSVISVLARLDIDPWQEAAKLARMSRDKAAWRLAALIETLPGDPAIHMHSKAIATRLIALLPGQIVITLGAPKGALPAGNSANIRFIVALILLNALFMAFSFGSQYFSGNHPPAAASSHVHSSATSKRGPAAVAPRVSK
jgi:hypothetical protein